VHPLSGGAATPGAGVVGAGLFSTYFLLVKMGFPQNVTILNFLDPVRYEPGLFIIGT
jgi:hypothetical protein